MLKNIHICNPNTPDSSSCKNIVSQKELEEVKEDSYGAYLVHIHLNWEENKLSNNYGFDIAQLIRLVKKSKLPIIFYSPIQKEYFEQKSKTEIKYRLLYSPGTAFLETPASPQTLFAMQAKLPTLSAAALQDISLMLCDTKGLVLDKLNHDLKFGKEIVPVLKEIEPFLDQKQKVVLDWEIFSKEILSVTKDEQEFETIKRIFLNKANLFLTETLHSVNAAKTNFKVLLIDDVPEELEKARLVLSKSFDVIPVQDAQKALKNLQEDIKNDIKVVISDWRLYIDESKTYWQAYQGYDILQYAGSTGDRELVALTSQADFIINHIRNSQNLKITLYKKQFLSDENQWQVFSNLVYEKCIEVVNREAGKITSKTWTKTVEDISYRQLYFMKKNSLTGYSFFRSVDEQVSEYWKYIMSFADGDFKGVNAIKIEYNLEIPKKPLDLKIALIHRRLWIGLWHYLTFNSHSKSNNEAEKIIFKIFKIICRGYYGDTHNPSPNDINAEINKIFLQRKDFTQKNYLLEEKNWLRSKELLLG